MPNFYKVVVKATALTQEVNTILYYGTTVPSEEQFDAGIASGLGTAVGQAQVNSWQWLLPTALTWQSVDVSMVDEDGVTVSPYIVTEQLAGAGQLNEPVDTVALVGIAKFNCTPVSQAVGHPVPRRSYVCVGPLLASQIGQGGALSGLAAFQTAAEAAFTQGHLISGTLYEPYRVGRTEPVSSTNPDGTIAGVGRVVAVTFRPYASFRRSRMISPTGS